MSNEQGDSVDLRRVAEVIVSGLREEASLALSQQLRTSFQQEEVEFIIRRVFESRGWTVVGGS